MGAERTVQQGQLGTDASTVRDRGPGPGGRRWDPRSARLAAAAATVLLVAAAALLARAAFDPTAVAWWLLAASAALAGVAAPLARQPGIVPALPATLAAAAGVLVVLAAATGADAGDWPAPAALAALVGAVWVALVLLGLLSSLGRTALVAAAALSGLGSLWCLTLLLTDDAVHTGAVQAVAAVLVLGVLARAALTDAGLTAWGRRPSAGTPVSRLGAAAALALTHRGLVGATLVAAASATAAGWLTAARPDMATTLFVAVLATVLWSRARAYPLLVEVLVLRAGAVALLVRLAAVRAQHSDEAAAVAVALLGLAAVLPLVATSVTVSESLRGRLTRAMGITEAVGVIALFPLALGVFGVHTLLLGAF